MVERDFGMEIVNFLLVFWVIFTIIKDKLEWWFILKGIDWILCFYCLATWSYFLYSQCDIIEAAKVGFISYWYIRFQEYLKIKLRK